MFEGLENGWAEEKKRATRGNVYRAWLATALFLLTFLIQHYEKLSR
jgi:hypothetical protein